MIPAQDTWYGVVVVGAGLGGLRTVEALRKHGMGGSIVLLGAEPHPPYDRPPLTKAVLRGSVDATVLPVDLDGLDVELRTGARVVGIDTGAHRVRLAGGKWIGYGALVLAPGAEARWLPGSRGVPGVHVLRTIDDALAVRAAVSVHRRAVVIGGGFIGCEAAASLRSTGADVDLVEALPAPLMRVLGPAAADVVTEVLTEHGVRVHAGVGVSELLADTAVRAVRLDDGRRLDADVVVLGLGVTPDLAWLDGSGIEVGDGITCDGTGRTSVQDVWALGDAAAWHHPTTGVRARIEHWTTAGDQARTVAADIATGHVAPLDEVPYFWSDVFDVKIQALGFVDPFADTHVVRPGDRTVVVYSRGGRVIAVVGFSAARHVMRLRTEVAERAPVEKVLASLAG